MAQNYSVDINAHLPHRGASRKHEFVLIPGGHFSNEALAAIRTYLPHRTEDIPSLQLSLVPSPNLGPLNRGRESRLDSLATDMI